jgi:hypothetical protein
MATCSAGEGGICPADLFPLSETRQNLKEGLCTRSAKCAKEVLQVEAQQDTFADVGHGCPTRAFIAPDVTSVSWR